MSSYTEKVLAQLKQKNPNEDEFIQANQNLLIIPEHLPHYFVFTQQIETKIYLNQFLFHLGQEQLLLIIGF